MQKILPFFPTIISFLRRKSPVLLKKPYLLKITFFCTLGISVLLLFWCFLPIPKNRLSNYEQSWLIYSRDGRLIREAVGADGTRTTWISLDSISPWVPKAIIAIEDKRFYIHPGIDPIALARSFLHAVIKGHITSGASTISMQLARLLFKCPRSLPGKISQCAFALRLERSLSKRKILEHYLNRAGFGAGCIGIEAASRRYFGKSSHSLTIAESALLAALPQSPTILNPLVSPAKAKRRQQKILSFMYKRKIITREEYTLGISEQIKLGGTLPQLHAMHFTDYVLSQKPKPGPVTTTLNLDLQLHLEKMVADHVASLRSQGLTNAAIIVLDNTNGEILAMVGSSDYWKLPSGSVNGATSLRQPGSTLKPFTYALSFEKGKTPATIVADIETEYVGSKGNLFSPRNYSHTFHGPVLMREALGKSLNIPAIRLLNFIGVEPLLERLHQCGFTSLNQGADHYGLGLTLGDGEVTLLELVEGYAMFARGGTAVKSHAILNSSDTTQPKSVFSKEICFLITDILSDEQVRVEAFGLLNPLIFDFPFALKTGTSANWRDSWVIGYCKDYTVGVWCGDFEGATMNEISGAVGAGPLFNRVVNLLVYGSSIPRIPIMPAPPPGVEQISICPLSGLRPGDYCPTSKTVYVLKEATDRPVCDVHRKLRIDSRNGLLASDHCPSRYVKEHVFVVLPPKFARWQTDYGTFPLPPVTYSPLCPQCGITANALVITSPRNGERYLIEPGYNISTQSIPLKGESDPPLPYIHWTIDGKNFTKTEWPYTAAWPLSKGKHQIRMSGGGMISDPVEIEVR
jgi:penicillin-binding protein 1C